MSTYINAIQADAVTKDIDRMKTQLSAVNFDFMPETSTELKAREDFKVMFQKLFNSVMQLK